MFVVSLGRYGVEHLNVNPPVQYLSSCHWAWAPIYAMRFDQKIYGAQENSKTKLIRSCSNSTERERRNQTTFFSRCMSIEAPHSVQVYHTFNEDADWDHLQCSSCTSFCGDFLKFVVSMDVMGGRWTLPVRHTNNIGSLPPPSNLFIAMRT